MGGQGVGVERGLDGVDTLTSKLNNGVSSTLDNIGVIAASPV